MLRLTSCLAVLVVLGNGQSTVVGIEFIPPVNLGPPINTSFLEGIPGISRDGLTMFFPSDRPGGEGDRSIWQARRELPTDPFGTPTNVAATNSPFRDFSPKVSADGSTLYFASTRPGSGESGIWQTSRLSVHDPFGVPTIVENVNTGGTEDGPCVSSDGLTLFFKSNRPGGEGDFDIWYSTRSSVGVPFGDPINPGSPLNSAFEDGEPCISYDGLSLYFSSKRPGGVGERSIWMAPRESDKALFGAPVSLGPVVNADADDIGPFISGDGSTLYFSSNRSGGHGDYDIWVTTVIPEPSTLILLATGGLGLLALEWRRRRRKGIVRLTSCLAVLVVSVGVRSAISAELPSVAGFDVEVYAEITDPQRLSFDSTGALFVGRENAGSGGGTWDAVRIHRVAPGGASVAEFGDALPDPDSVLVDPTGLFSGVVGSVLVGGEVDSNSEGHISAIQPSETTNTIWGPTTSFRNVSDMAFDSTGRLVFTDFNLLSRSVFVSTGGFPTSLFVEPDGDRAASLALDTSDRIFTRGLSGTIRIHDSAGSLLDSSFAVLSSSGPIQFGPGGVWGADLYALSDDQLVRLDASGSVTVIGTGFATGGDGAARNSITFGPDGALYVAEFDSDRILRIIPEPSTFVMLTMGAVGLLAYALRKRRQR